MESNEIIWGDNSTWGKKEQKGITWLKKRKDPATLQDLPSDKEVLMNREASIPAVNNAMRRVLLELMDMHEELHESFKRFGL